MDFKEIPLYPNNIKENYKKIDEALEKENELKCKLKLALEKQKPDYQNNILYAVIWICLLVIAIILNYKFFLSELEDQFVMLALTLLLIIFSTYKFTSYIKGTEKKFEVFKIKKNTETEQTIFQIYSTLLSEKNLYLFLGIPFNVSFEGGSPHLLSDDLACDYLQSNVPWMIYYRKVLGIVERYPDLFFPKLDMSEQRKQFFKMTSDMRELNSQIAVLKNFKSNLTAIPYMSAIMADYETYNIEVLAKSLDWGHNIERQKKVASIRTIRNAAKEIEERNLSAKYNLEYLLQLYPALADIIETDYYELPLAQITSSIENLEQEYDNARNWLSKEEYNNLSSVERNQLALERYKNREKSKWEIGRDYELYVGHIYEKKGYRVEYTGSLLKFEDLGRDLIASKDDTVLIIQCKRWAKEKVIHEKHIYQLFGTTVSYKIENDNQNKNIKGVFVTTAQLSDVAKKAAEMLEIKYIENFQCGEYPCIKCNIGRDNYGQKTKIYHLPFDQQYDNTMIVNPGEFMAMTVKEAEDAGFRRAFKWFGNQ